MDSRLLPEPDSEFGYSDRQTADLLGERIADFREYMLMKTYAIAADGSAAYYVSDVRRYIEHSVPPRARQLTEQEAEELLHSRRPELDGDSASDWPVARTLHFDSGPRRPSQLRHNFGMGCRRLISPAPWTPRIRR